MSAEVAVRVNDYYTASNTAAPTACRPHVVYLGLVSTVFADGMLGSPEAVVDLGAAGRALHGAAKVVEYDTSPVNTRSPFGV